MGWKASTLIINKPIQIDEERLLRGLGYSNLRKIEDEPFETAISPDDNKVYIGTYKDNLLICEQELPARFFEQTQTKEEKLLSQLFTGSEICAIILHSAVNLWGYSIAINGEKIRARAGSANDGTFCEMGEPVEEEKELLSRSTINEDGNRVYLFEDLPNEPMTEDQVGENFVFAITKRYFGEELDSADELLFETTLTGYAFGDIANTPKVYETIVDSPPEESVDSVPEEKKAWWKFW